MAKLTFRTTEKGDEFVPDMNSSISAEVRSGGSVRITILQDDLGEYAERQEAAIHAEYTLTPEQARAFILFLQEASTQSEML
jgi:hypothetical protein